MRISFDEDNNIAYLTLAEGAKSVKQKTIELAGGMIIVDVDNDGAVIGFEFFNASTLLRHAREPAPPRPIPPDRWGAPS